MTENDTDKTPEKAEPEKRKGPSCLFLLIIAMMFAAIIMDLRLVISIFVLIAVTSTTAALEKTGTLNLKISDRIHALSVLLLVVFWLFWGIYTRYIERNYIIPTTEYREDHPRWSGLNLNYKTVDLSEKATLQLGVDAPRLDGATTFFGLYRSFAKAVYSDTMHDVLEYSATPEAYRHLLNGSVDMIFVYPPSAEQREAAAARGKQFVITPIGRDAFVFFVNTNNPVDNLTIEQLRGIYSGKIDNWRDVGGPYAPVAAYQRYEGSGSQSRMERFMDGAKLMEPAAEYRFQDMYGIISHAARYHNYRHAIGYSFRYYVEVMMRGGGVKMLAVNGVKPEVATIRDGSYPLRDEICVVTAGSKNPNVQPFIEWILSPQGQEIVEKIGYVPISGAEGGGETKPSPQSP